MISKDNMKKSYVEPEDAPPGKPCRICDEPGYPDHPVIQDGTAPDGRPLYAHESCQTMVNSDKKTDALPPALGALLHLGPHWEEEEDIWAFASVNKYAAGQESPDDTYPGTEVEAESEYENDGTGASVPPSR